MAARNHGQVPDSAAHTRSQPTAYSTPHQRFSPHTTHRFATASTNFHSSATAWLPATSTLASFWRFVSNTTAAWLVAACTAHPTSGPIYNAPPPPHPCSHDILPISTALGPATSSCRLTVTPNNTSFAHSPTHSTPPAPPAIVPFPKPPIEESWRSTDAHWDAKRPTWPRRPTRAMVASSRRCRATHL